MTIGHLKGIKLNPNALLAYKDLRYRVKRAAGNNCATRIKDVPGSRRHTHIGNMRKRERDLRRFRSKADRGNRKRRDF